uniref:C2H2-type domain-containing protein n=1 Tax=Globodera rostochiensis TaxID=31243 RepID=A0A914HJ89_GLORO
MEETPPPPVEGLRRSKRNNKYHLDVASLLLSSSSTIRRDVSPPSPVKKSAGRKQPAQQQVHQVQHVQQQTAVLVVEQQQQSVPGLQTQQQKRRSKPKTSTLASSTATTLAASAGTTLASSAAAVVKLRTTVNSALTAAMVAGMTASSTATTAMTTETTTTSSATTIALKTVTTTAVSSSSTAMAGMTTSSAGNAMPTVTSSLPATASSSIEMVGPQAVPTPAEHETLGLQTVVNSDNLKEDKAEACVTTTTKMPKNVQQRKDEDKLEAFSPPALTTATSLMTTTTSILETNPQQILDIQLPDQILEEDSSEDAPLAPPSEQQQQATPSAGQPAQVVAAPSADAPPVKWTTTVVSENGTGGSSSSNRGTLPPNMAPPATNDSVQQQQQTKRKRKVPLKHQDYFNGKQADEDDDDLEEQMLFKAVKVEYTMPDGSKSVDEHACPKCPAVFDSRVGLTNHLKLHGSKKEFPCELCDFACTNKKTMRQHRRVHGLSRRSRNTATTTNVVVKSEFSAVPKSSGAFVPSAEHVQPASSSWPKRCCLNLDRLAAQSRGSIEVTTTTFKPISNCSTVADVAKLVTQMHERKLLKAEEELNRRKQQQQQQQQQQQKQGGGGMDEEDDEEDAMPVLEQQQQLRLNSMVDEQRNINQQQQQQQLGAYGDADERCVEEEEAAGEESSGNGRKASTSSAGGGGGKAYDRNTVQCPHCPFRTQSKQRLQPHVSGHTRASGFRCSACGFKSESSGFLRRHSQLHDEPCKWPPDYVGVPHQRIAKLLEGRSHKAELVVTIADDNNGGTTSSSNMDGSDKFNQYMERNSNQQQQMEQEVVEGVESVHKLIKMEMNEFNEDEHDEIVVEEMEVDECKTPAADEAAAVNKFRWSSQLIADRWNAYQKRCLQIRPPHGPSFINSNATLRPPSLRWLFCGRCQLRCHSGPAQFALHNTRHHRFMGQNRLALCRELLAERLAWRDDRGDGIEYEFTAALSSSNGRGEERRTTSPPSSADVSLDGTATSTTITGAAGGKVYRCRSCPFSTDQIFRLQKHENKHLVKSDHQCSHCSFSCRSLDILAQHKRLHEDGGGGFMTMTMMTEQCSTISSINCQPPASAALLTATASSSSSTTAQPPVDDVAADAASVEQPTTALCAQQQQQMVALSATRLAPIRRNEAHYCPHCPYSSKHNCDMKAHMKMHEVRSKFACSLCTYSTKRQNALIAHEQLHRKGPLLGSPAVLGPRGAKCRRLKRIVLLKQCRRRNSSSIIVPFGERIRFDGARTHFYRCAHRDCGEEVPFCADLARHARNHCMPSTAGAPSAMPSMTTVAASSLLLFRCEQCSFSTMLEHRLKAHQAATHNRGIGGEEFSEKNARTDAGIFKCKECPFATVNYAKFWNHRQKHKRTNRFTCKHCSFSSGSVQCYAEHMALHGHLQQQQLQLNAGVDDDNNLPSGEEEEAMMSTTTTTTTLTGTMMMMGPLAKKSTKNRDKEYDEEEGNTKMEESSSSSSPEGTKTAITEASAVADTEVLLPQAFSSTMAQAQQQQRRSPIFQWDKFEQFDAALPPTKHMKTMNGMDVELSSSDSSSAATTTSSASSKICCCSECPFETVHAVLLKLHMEMHRHGACRPFACALCSFGCFSAESLHAHLSMHASATALEGGGNGTRTADSTPTESGGGGLLCAGGPFSALNNATTATAAAASVVVSSSVYACSQCSFKSTELEQFLNHRKEHVQLLQQRLMTIIKRAAVDNLNSASVGNGGTKMDKISKALGGRTIDKQHYCTRCSFRCDSVQAFTRHWEHHRIDGCRPGMFKCSVCDYSSNTHNVVLFHEHNHHLDIPLTSLCRNIELVQQQPEQMPVGKNIGLNDA